MPACVLLHPSDVRLAVHQADLPEGLWRAQWGHLKNTAHTQYSDVSWSCGTGGKIGTGSLTSVMHDLGHLPVYCCPQPPLAWWPSPMIRMCLIFFGGGAIVPGCLSPNEASVRLLMPASCSSGSGRDYRTCFRDAHDLVSLFLDLTIRFTYI